MAIPGGLLLHGGPADDVQICPPGSDVCVALGGRGVPGLLPRMCATERGPGRTAEGYVCQAFRHHPRRGALGPTALGVPPSPATVDTDCQSPLTCGRGHPKVQGPDRRASGSPTFPCGSGVGSFAGGLRREGPTFPARRRAARGPGLKVIVSWTPQDLGLPRGPRCCLRRPPFS